ncbi:MAG: MoxR family ATPase [Gammaproteobacteria bacterium]|nr:MoxR family ATPase [Gammaproteobacteria bacterium]
MDAPGQIAQNHRRLYAGAVFLLETPVSTRGIVRPDSDLGAWRSAALKLESEINSTVLGQEEVARLLVIAVFGRGHVLLEGDVGVGKTTMLRCLARLIGGGYERVEGTIDLMPSDLIYHTFVDEQGKPRVAPGPLLKHGAALSTFFFNEVNRARPQMHSLLLRVMAERSVTAFDREYRFPHLQVYADRNRVEKEETFEIPAAARDRFLMELEIRAPADPELQRRLMVETRFHDVDALLERLPHGLVAYEQLNDVAASVQSHVQATATLQTYALDLCRATSVPGAFGVRISDVDIERFVQAGVSPRGMSLLLRAARIAAWLRGRNAVAPEDIHQVFLAAIAHRVFLKPVYELRRSELVGEFLSQVLSRVAAP